MANWTEADIERLSLKQRKPAAKQTGTQRMQALGRMKTGQMNKTEERFAQMLELERHAGKVQWWKFEAIKLMLAKNTSLTVDFAVLPDTGILTMIDVKGSKAMVTDDARAKMKIAAELYPFVFKLAYPRAKGEGWDIEEIVP